MTKLEWNTKEVSRKIVSLDETYLAIAYVSSDGKLGKQIRLVNWQTGAEYGKLMGHVRDVWALIKLEPTCVASGSEDTTIKIWNYTSGRLKQNLTGHRGIVYDLLSLRNFSQLLSCSLDRTIKLWNKASGREIRTLTDRSLSFAMILLSGNDLLATNEGSKILIWNLTRAITIQILDSHSNKVRTLANIEGRQNWSLASGAFDWKIKIWRLVVNSNSNSQVKTLSGHFNYVTDLVALPNGHLASGSSDMTIRIWNLEDTQVSLVKTMFAHSDLIYCLGLLVDGNLASGSADGTIKIWHFDKNSTEYSSKDYFEITFKFFKLYRTTASFSDKSKIN
jgi:WD40 repeat protein